MKYNVIAFKSSGRLLDSLEVEAKSMTDAAFQIKYNKIVRGPKTARFFHKTKALMYRAEVYKVSLDYGYYVMVLVKNIPFMFKYSKKEQRNEAFKCAQESAKIAGVGQQQTAIIASLEGAKGMKNTSTALKTLSKSVENATKAASSTASHIGSSFGSEDADNSDTQEWSGGYRNFPRKFKAQVDYLPTHSAYVNEYMQKMLKKGEIFLVEKVQGTAKRVLYQGGGWSWKARWLKPAVEEKKFFRYLGKTVELTKHSPGIWQTESGKLINEALLYTTGIKVKVKRGARSVGSCNFTEEMKELIGQTITVEHNGDRYYNGEWYWLHEWLELPDAQPEPEAAYEDMKTPQWKVQYFEPEDYTALLTQDTVDKLKAPRWEAGFFGILSKEKLDELKKKMIGGVS